MGSYSGDGSGDIFIAFSTANPGAWGSGAVKHVAMVPNDDMNPLFLATVQIVEEAVVNALIAAKTMKGINDFEVDAIPHAKLQQVLKKYNRLGDLGSSIFVLKGHGFSRADASVILLSRADFSPREGSAIVFD